MLLVLIAGAALGVAAWLVFGTPFAKDPVTKAQIEHAVAQTAPRSRAARPLQRGGHPLADAAFRLRAHLDV
jgi:hypothetical protein